MGTSDIKSTPPVTTILLSMAGVDIWPNIQKCIMIVETSEVSLIILS